MRVKRQKKNRRTVRFFTVCFGFRQPFKVLCDGTFVHHLVSKEITPADAAVSELLGGPVKLFTTRCVLAELQKLGKDYSESLEAAQMLSTATCEHEEAKPADECLSEVLGIKNSEHFFLGTQDFEFRKKLQQGPNPLSCMKKKKVNDTKRPQSKSKAEHKAGGQEEKNGESGLKKRTRKRSKKGKSGQEITE
ncbi:hypothetical protein Bca52824_048988 [Brassica carinata]|uniref:rRNA-processing protein UTP23 homolog n=1 Tax=Brassica carinata TaxID=52824 RepID=A0A8X7RHT0_BRACI|nr:hypothetical protein Bca52824_048988 [Brassica carinata]